CLVKCFSGSIVQCLSQDFHMIVGVNQYDLGVPSGDCETEKWKPGNRIVDKMRKYVGFHMIDLYAGHLEPLSQCFGESNAYQQRTHQARAPGESYGVDLLFRDSGSLDSSGDHPANRFQMFPGS